MKKAVAFLIALVLLGYGFFEARRLIAGPVITIETPVNGSATSSGAVLVSGTAENIAFLTINDRPAFTDEDGRFSERVSAPPGYTVFTVLGKDRFGRESSKQVHFSIVNFCPIS
jgi:hypothetical protein